MATSNTGKRKWGIDFGGVGGGSGIGSGISSSRPATTKADFKDLQQKKAWEVAKGPGKQILMTAFMLWMAGSGVNIFSIMITMYNIINPVKAIIATNSVFIKFSDGKNNMLEPKAVYIALNLVALAIAVYKCSTLGLLPTTPSDWVSMLPVKQAVEFSGGGFV